MSASTNDEPPSAVSATPNSFANVSWRRAASRATSARSTASRLTANSLRFMRARSRRSRTSRSRRRPSRRIVRAASSGSNAPSASPSAYPRIAVSGVFSSWLTESRKFRSLSRAAASSAAISLKARASEASSSAPLSGSSVGVFPAARARLASTTRRTGRDDRPGDDEREHRGEQRAREGGEQEIAKEGVPGGRLLAREAQQEHPTGRERPVGSRCTSCPGRSSRRCSSFAVSGTRPVNVASGLDDRPHAARRGRSSCRSSPTAGGRARRCRPAAASAATWVWSTCLPREDRADRDRKRERGCEGDERRREQPPAQRPHVVTAL